MHKLLKENNNPNIPIYEHICETIADLENIPKNQINFGSIALVLSDGAIDFFIANSKRKWIKV